MKKRRSSEEVAKLSQEAQALIDGGSTVQDACAKVDLEKSVFDRWRKSRSRGKSVIEENARKSKEVLALIQGGMKGIDALKKIGLENSAYYGWKKRTKDGTIPDPALAGRSGSMDISALPPRPKKGPGGHPRRALDLNDVPAVAKRIGRIDVLLRGFDALTRERKALATRLMELLKGTV